MKKNTIIDVTAAITAAATATVIATPTAVGGEICFDFIEEELGSQDQVSSIFYFITTVPSQMFYLSPVVWSLSRWSLNSSVEPEP